MRSASDHPTNDELPPAIRCRLDELRATGGDAALREFATWCALQVSSRHPAVSNVIASVRNAARDTTGEHLQSLRGQWAGAALSAGVIGMRVNPASASAHLAAFQCALSCAYEAAAQAARHVRNSFAFAAKASSDTQSITGFPGLEAAAEAMGCQIDQLDRMIAACGPLQAEGDSDSNEGGR